MAMTNLTLSLLNEKCCHTKVFTPVNVFSSMITTEITLMEHCCLWTYWKKFNYHRLVVNQTYFLKILFFCQGLLHLTVVAREGTLISSTYSCSGNGDAGACPGGQEAVMHLGQVASQLQGTHFHTPRHTPRSNLEPPISPRRMSLDWGTKREYYCYTGTQDFLLKGNNVKHCTTMPPSRT